MVRGRIRFMSSREGKMNLRQFQKEVGEWSRENFGDQPSDNPLLGMAEEVGELCHAHLKGKQGIRYDKGQVNSMKLDAVADLLIYTADYCEREGIDLESTIEVVWKEIRKRDWRENPKTAHLKNS